jgi:hypothetical protein
LRCSVEDGLCEGLRRSLSRSRENRAMPIRPEYRWLYPIDWKQLSAVIRFERAKGRCQGCRRPHGRIVCHLGDGHWWDPERRTWRDGQGRRVPGAEVLDLLAQVRSTRVVLATAHRDHDPNEQQPTQPGGVLPEMPPPTRSTGTPPPTLAHPLPEEGTRRPLPWTLSLTWGGCSDGGQEQA